MSDRPECVAHRMAWRFANKRRIPKGKWILHHCDNPSCVRPSHLYVGTQQDNTNDCIRRGRFVRARHVKMTLEQVIDARRRYAAGESQLSIGKSMGISQAHISKVVRNTLWKEAVWVDAAMGVDLAHMEEVK